VQIGNERLGFDEQSRVLQNAIFTPHAAFWTDASGAMANWVAPIKSVIPGASPFLTVVPDGNIGVAADRIQWYSDNLRPAFSTWEAGVTAIDVDILLRGGY